MVRSRVVLALWASTACAPGATDAEPGENTGPCLDDECFVGLICRDDRCLDADLVRDEDGPNPAPTPSGPTSVSVLVVVGDHATMADEQARLARAIGSLATKLASAGIDWRIAVTTTDNGSPECTSPSEGGRFVLSSCRERLADFATQSDAAACEDACPAEWPTIATDPSVTADDATTARRPWVEMIGGRTNLPPGLTTDVALACVVPQGTAGCRYGEPLESMYKAITRTSSPSDPAYGFLPDDALLAVVIATDAGDCSFNKVHPEIFAPDGNRIFWSDPQADAPTPAVCFNASTVCLSNGCRATDFDGAGNLVPPADAEADAVIRPVPRYVDRLRDRDDTIVALLAGVAPDGSVTYEPGDDETYLLEHGIGPGCEGDSGPARAPVRLLEVADAVSGVGSAFSVCDPDYGPALDALADRILAAVDAGG